MNNEEVNRIIVEFECRALVKRGYYWFLRDCMGELTSVYTESLDTQTPVYKKLNTTPQFWLNTATGKYMGEISSYCVRTEYEFDTMEEAGAHVLAKAIKELE